MKFYFIGGLFSPAQMNLIVTSSKGVIQNAADALQWGLVKGLSEQDDCSVEVINLPFVGSFPARFKKAFFPSTNETILNKVKITGLKFINLTLVKYISRIISLSRHLRRIVADLNDSVIIIYSTHIPFLYSATRIKAIAPTLRICLVIPDLPQHMNDTPNIAYRLLKNIEIKLFNRMLHDVDFFVTLTSGMQTSLGLPANRCVVIEGVAHEDSNKTDHPHKKLPRFIFYSGTLASRYGIKDLLDAFHSIKDIDAELWICGDGDSREYVEYLASTDPRIKYLGQLERSDVISLQREALLLVNPRTPEGDYTKYSFPSKIMEYMISGRPVIMHQLDGIPSEYYQHCFSPKNTSVAALAECLRDAASYAPCILNEKGLSARNFVLNSKTPKHQTQKIINLIKGL